MNAVLLLLLGLVVLTVGAELLVRGASKIALAAGLPPLIVGLTVVAYGTSAPELAVSVRAALAGQGDLALGNVLGSNVFNVLLVLGCSAVIIPLLASRQLVRLDVPILIAVCAGAWALAADGSFSRLDGLVLTGAGIVYTVLLIGMGRRQTKKEKAARAADPNVEDLPDPPKTLTGFLAAVGLLGAGLAGLVFGAQWLVDGAVTLARGLGVSDLVIGLTVVAAGTSAPELATSVVAAFRGERDLAVGNVVGSSIFNFLAVLGPAAAVAPAGIPVAPGVLHFDLPVVVAVAVVCLPIFLTNGVISRIEGGLFLAYFVLYTVYLFFSSTDHHLLEPYSAAVLFFVVPLTALGLLTSVAVWFKRGRPAPSS